MNESDEDFTTGSVEQIFDNFEDPFINLKTSYMQSSVIQNNPNFVQPLQYVLGTRAAYKNKGPKRQLCEKDDTLIYIPILDSLQQLLSNSSIADIITSHPSYCKEGILYDICDGQCFKNNPIFQEHPNALQIILYHDEVEICNPLGSHVGKHKIDLYYYTLSNISPKHRSKLRAIRLLAIVKAKDVSKYGQNKILTPIINDLQRLANGYTFIINGTPIELFGAVVSCLGDTEGQHQWGGFKVKVGWAHQKCRNCLCTFVNMQQNFRDSHFTQRSMEQYHRQCDDIERAPNDEMMKDLQTTYGITERSLLTKLPAFDLTKQLPQDIMHILLEGAVQFEVRYILQHFMENRYLTLKELNTMFSQMSLGYLEERNRPPPLRETVFNGNEKYKLKLTAEQASIFLRYLPFCIKGYVSSENQFYQLLLQIISIVQMCFSPVTSKETINEIQNSIETHLVLFKELFPQINITPKMHYMLHIPTQMAALGPLIRHCCIRFEARHRYFKELAPQQNFKNICLSLAEKSQLDDCADFDTENPSEHPLFSTDKELGPTTPVINESRAAILRKIEDAKLFVKPEMINKVFTAKWIKLYGTKYVTNNTCIIAVDATFVDKVPTFGKLQQIWLVDKEILFEFKPLTTVEFDPNLMAYQVYDLGDDALSELCFYNRMLDFNVYSLQRHSDAVYIPLKYDLRDIIREHIVGENPLHF